MDKTTQDRIKADATAAYADIHGFVAYTKGAMAEAEKTEVAVDKALHTERNAIQAKMTEMETGYLKQINNLLDVLQKIVHAPVPANEREYISWFVTAKNIAGGAISDYEADREVRQWKGGKGKEAGDE
jgi:hypothetical protein